MQSDGNALALALCDMLVLFIVLGLLALVWMSGWSPICWELY